MKPDILCFLLPRRLKVSNNVEVAVKNIDGIFSHQAKCRQVNYISIYGGLTFLEMLPHIFLRRLGSLRNNGGILLAVLLDGLSDRICLRGILA